MFRRALEIIGALPSQTVLVDDLLENVLAARSVGMTAFQFRDTFVLERDLMDAGLL
jgi:HAD superfamily hydrolase (TIGR01509 family)